MTAQRLHQHERSNSFSADQSAVSAETIATTAARCMTLELETWPKPGLVSHVDNGSHDDMNAETFRASVKAITPHFKELAEAGAAGSSMGRLRIIGLEAEAAMFAATAGVNTHRGAIFGLGLLCAAAGARSAGQVHSALALGAVVTQLWRDGILDGPRLLRSHGEGARRRFGSGGARMEAAEGFPSIYQVGLPALRRGIRVAQGDAEAARVEVCFALIAALEDTNLIHRGGAAGLQFANRAAQRFLDDGGVSNTDWRERAGLVHRHFIDRWLSPGGSADLLAMTLFVGSFDGVWRT